MPELDFKGKEFVRNHHLTVPYRPLEPVHEKGIGEPDITGNLIIHGDNLEALKALLPMYAGKVDCIFIDPPYNTGAGGVALDKLVRLGWIGEATWISLETEANEEPKVRSLETVAERKVGKARISLLRLPL